MRESGRTIRLPYLDTEGKKLVENYPKEAFYEDWKIGCLQFVVGVLALGMGTFATPQENRMADLWMFAISRYMMGMAVLGVPEYVKETANKLGFEYPSGKKLS